MVSKMASHIWNPLDINPNNSVGTHYFRMNIVRPQLGICVVCLMPQEGKNHITAQEADPRRMR